LRSRSWGNPTTHARERVEPMSDWKSRVEEAKGHVKVELDSSDRD
jgi:hypothetical protein